MTAEAFHKSTLPTAKELEQARETKVHDERGEELLLGSLFTPNEEDGTAVVVFIRHFLCGLCECPLFGRVLRTLPDGRGQLGGGC